MVVLSISVIKSPVEKVSGIPITISLVTNIPATVFYTLDGTTPTNSSLVATGPISLSTDSLNITLKAFATDGINTSSIISQLFGPNNPNLRLSHAKISNIDGDLPVIDLFPFGGIFPNNPPRFNGIAGTTMDSPPFGDGYADGYDGTNTGTIASETDLPLSKYKLIYSETDSQGKSGRGIGTLPSKTTIKKGPATSSYSETNSSMFNPKALVIFQDGTKEQYDPNETNIMRPYFSLGDNKVEKIRDGAMLSNTAFEGSGVTGSFVKSHYNARDNTINYYYYDNAEGRWIISKVPFQPKPGVGILYSMVFPANRDEGAGFVYRWIPFARRVLF